MENESALQELLSEYLYKKNTKGISSMIKAERLIKLYFNWACLRLVKKWNRHINGAVKSTFTWINEKQNGFQNEHDQASQVPWAFPNH